MKVYFLVVDGWTALGPVSKEKIDNYLLDVASTSRVKIYEVQDANP